MHRSRGGGGGGPRAAAEARSGGRGAAGAGAPASPPPSAAADDARGTPLLVRRRGDPDAERVHDWDVCLWISMREGLPRRRRALGGFGLTRRRRFEAASRRRRRCKSWLAAPSPSLPHPLAWTVAPERSHVYPRPRPRAQEQTETNTHSACCALLLLLSSSSTPKRRRSPRARAPTSSHHGAHLRLGHGPLGQEDPGGAVDQLGRAFCESSSPTTPLLLPRQTSLSMARGQMARSCARAPPPRSPPPTLPPLNNQPNNKKTGVRRRAQGQVCGGQAPVLPRAPALLAAAQGR